MTVVELHVRAPSFAERPHTSRRPDHLRAHCLSPPWTRRTTRRKVMRDATRLRVRLLVDSPPPFALTRTVGASGAIEGIEIGDVLTRELEVEELRVLGDAFAVCRLRDDRD